jgi:putative FmdB family regulatory protein
LPLYEFECKSCNHRFERIQSFSDADPEKCPNCGKGPVERLLAAPAVQFKGSGFYVTDYARSGAGKSEGSGKAESKSEGGASKSEAGAKSESSSSSSSGGESKPASTASDSTKS